MLQPAAVVRSTMFRRYFKFLYPYSSAHTTLAYQSLVATPMCQLGTRVRLSTESIPVTLCVLVFSVDWTGAQKCWSGSENNLIGRRYVWTGYHIIHGRSVDTSEPRKH